MIFDQEKLLFSPHPKAPTFSQDADPRSLLTDLIKEVTSQNFHVTDSMIQLIREAGYVSLWFYLKYVLGFSGPYEKLDDKLHLAMCNFRHLSRNCGCR